MAASRAWPAGPAFLWGAAEAAGGVSLPRPRLEPQSCSLSRGPCPASPDRRWPQLPCLCLWDVGVTVPRLPSSGPRRPDARPSSHRETPGQPSSPLPEALGVGPPGTATGSPLPASQRSASCWELRPRVAAPAELPLGGCHLAPRGRGSWPPWSPQWGWSGRRPSRPSQAAGSRGHAVPRASLLVPPSASPSGGLRAPHFSSALSAGTGGSAQVGSARRGQRSSTPSSHHSRALTQPSRHGGVWWPWVHGQEREHRLRSPGNSGSSPCPRPQQVTGQARCPLGSLFLSSVRRGLAAPRGCLR